MYLSIWSSHLTKKLHTCLHNHLTWLTKLHTCLHNRLTWLTKLHTCLHIHLTWLAKLHTCLHNHLTWLTKLHTCLHNHLTWLAKPPPPYSSPQHISWQLAKQSVHTQQLQTRDCWTCRESGHGAQYSCTECLWNRSTWVIISIVRRVKPT